MKNLFTFTLLLFSIYACVENSVQSFQEPQEKYRWEFYLRGINFSSIDYFQNHSDCLNERKVEFLEIMKFVNQTVSNLQESMGGYNPENGFIFKNLSFEKWYSRAFVLSNKQQFKTLIGSMTHLSIEEKDRIISRMNDIMSRAETEKLSLVDVSIELGIYQQGITTLILD